jgi:hypothetical protein
MGCGQAVTRRNAFAKIATENCKSRKFARKTFFEKVFAKPESHAMVDLLPAGNANTTNQPTAHMKLHTNPILNLTQHSATAEQITDGVFDPNAEDRAYISGLLTFEQAPTKDDVRKRAKVLAQFAFDLCEEKLEESPGATVEHVMIGGAPYLMGPLERELEALRLVPVYAFSQRRSVDVPQPDGSVRKVTEFRHAGFVM